MYRRFIFFTLFIALFFAVPRSIFAKVLPPANSETGNIYLNSIHQDRTYNFTPTSQRPQPMRGYSSLGPQGMQKEVLGFAPYWDLNLTNCNSFTCGIYPSQYYPYQYYQYNNLRTIAYFGITSDGSGNFGTTNGPGWQGLQSAQFTDMVNIAHQNGVRVVIVVKIFNLADIESVINSNTNSQNLITNIINVVRQYNLQGVNIDFETSDGGYNATSTDTTNFTNFMQNLTSQMHSAVSGSFVSVDTVATAAVTPGSLYDIPALANVVDAINVMAYDYYSPSSASAYPNSPYTGYNNGNGPYWYDVKQTINSYAQTVPANKIIIGVPYYGNDYQTQNFNEGSPTIGSGISEPYGQTNDQYKNSNTKHWSSTSSTPWYGYCYPSNNIPPNCASTDQIRQGYYENSKSLSLIYNQILQDNLRGVSMWTLGYQQPSTSLWDVINNYFISNTLFSSANSAYYLLSAHGRVLPFGNANFFGDMSYMPSSAVPDNNANTLTPLPNDTGYYIMTSNGAVYTFGRAKFYGSVFNIPNAPDKNPVSLAVTPDGKGYYIMTQDGGVYTFGDAKFFGSMYNIPPSAIVNHTVISFNVSPTGNGYYITTADGAVYTFGDAQFHGSVYNIPAAPNKNAVTMQLTPSGNGYYIITQDGGVYTFGDAQFYGSMFNIPNAPVRLPVSFGVTGNNGGYYIMTADGGVYTFGNAIYDGTGIGIFSHTNQITVTQ
ncbi:glycosyl hydrolase family 18 protein [Patescibacteria group bacterium]|nr:glycosyl hydrolase family 18 protein [Patescibacteria group bacterium]